MRTTDINTFTIDFKCDLLIFNLCNLCIAGNRFIRHTVYLKYCLFSFCLQSVWMQYYRETESDPDFSSEIKPITPERTEPE